MKGYSHMSGSSGGKKSVPHKGLSHKVNDGARLGPAKQTKYTSGEKGRATPYGCDKLHRKKYN